MHSYVMIKEIVRIHILVHKLVFYLDISRKESHYYFSLGYKWPAKQTFTVKGNINASIIWRLALDPVFYVNCYLIGANHLRLGQRLPPDGDRSLSPLSRITHNFYQISAIVSPQADEQCSK